MLEKSALSLRLVRQPIVHATTCGHVFAVVTHKYYCEWCRVEEVTFCSGSDADRIRLVRCAVRSHLLASSTAASFVSAALWAGAVASMGEVLSAFVGLWDFVADMAGMTLAHRVTAMVL